MGGSVTGIMADLEDIWLNAIEKELDIRKQDLGRFKVSPSVITYLKIERDVCPTGGGGCMTPQIRNCL